MQYEDAYNAFLQSHVKKRSGPSAKRIVAGLEHAEKMFLKNVWWPAFHNFEGLHPEYEIRDFKDGHRYLDFAYIQPYFRIAIEIDGFGPHWKDISPDQYCDHCHRQNHLIIDRWQILRFGYKDVDERPRICQQSVQQLVGRITGDSSEASFQALKATDKEILRLALSINRPLTIRDVATRCQLGRAASARYLKGLVETGWLQPARGSVRVRAYHVHPTRSNIVL